MIKVEYTLSCDYCKKLIGEETFALRATDTAIPRPSEPDIHAGKHACDACSNKITKAVREALKQPESTGLTCRECYQPVAEGQTRCACGNVLALKA